MKLIVGCRLQYSMPEATCFLFQIQASMADGQIIESESLIVPATASSLQYEVYVHPTTGTRILRTTLGPGQATVEYRATVMQTSDGIDPALVNEVDFQNLPMDTIEYLQPSRYCASDMLTDFAFQTFGQHERGHQRVTAVCNWIHEHVTYTAGSTGPSSTASDVFLSRKGVCRDFAHLGIAICRALGIPARYASVYASAMNPQDFHAIFQAYLAGPDGGAWFSFDATQMASMDAVVRIASGRDAADVAFAWPQGEVKSEAPVVWADAPSRTSNEQTELAIAVGS